MKKWQIENSETPEISEIPETLFQVFLFPSFWFCPTAKIENSDLKISEKKFRVFRVFNLAEKDVICCKKQNWLFCNLWTSHRITAIFWNSYFLGITKQRSPNTIIIKSQVEV